jgi:metal-responsive CopG/Arc/MetJ family transcriptional regulator
MAKQKYTPTIPVTLSEEVVFDLDDIAKRELSSRNRIIRIAIKQYLEKNE